MGVAAALSVGIAAGLDALVGDPPNRFHPVAYFGRLVSRIDAQWRHPRLVGFLAALVLPLVAALAAWGLVTLALSLGWLAGAFVAGLVLSVSISLRMLVTTAQSVIEDTDSDPDAARDAIPALVGRDPDELSPGELRSAAVESAAENLADGLVAPLLAFALAVQLSPVLAAQLSLAIAAQQSLALGAKQSLALGAAAAAWVKGVNTLDSMLGYRSKPVGWASARLDDIVMFVPARVAAVAIAVAARRPRALFEARAWAREPPSPNSGWPMATLAAASDVRLVKLGVYDLNTDGALPDVANGRRAVRIVTGAGVLSVLACGVIAWF